MLSLLPLLHLHQHQHLSWRALPLSFGSSPTRTIQVLAHTPPSSIQDFLQGAGLEDDDPLVVTRWSQTISSQSTMTSQARWPLPCRPPPKHRRHPQAAPSTRQGLPLCGCTGFGVPGSCFCCKISTSGRMGLTTAIEHEPCPSSPPLPWAWPRKPAGGARVPDHGQQLWPHPALPCVWCMLQTHILPLISLDPSMILCTVV